jgi:hypothetical protein
MASSITLGLIVYIGVIIGADYKVIQIALS